jgi:hypothetical protein
LILIALGLVMAGVICLFGKHQREELRTQLEEDTEQGGKEQKQPGSWAEAKLFHGEWESLIEQDLSPQTRDLDTKPNNEVFPVSSNTAGIE